MEEARIPDVYMHVSHGCIIVPVQVELYDESLQQLQTDLLAKLAETGASGVVIDVSAVGVVDKFMGETLALIGQMSRLLGAQVVITGIRPAVAATMVDFDAPVTTLCWAGTLDDGLQMLANARLGECRRRGQYV